MNYKKALLFPLILLLFIAIFYNFKKEISFSFYHWENSYNLQNNQEKLYIKVLDINYSNKLEIIKTKFITKPTKGFVPVIYITNKAMDEEPLSLMVKKVLNNLKDIPYAYDEIQIDCDWSLSTKAKYFDFLREIKLKSNKKLSVTIRLHQIKYAKKTGIPPVDYGVLMYYNMSDIADFNTKNSILDNDVARQYHYNFDIYPLKLKLALPLYSQGVQFRNKKAIDIFEGLEKKDFAQNFTLIKKNFYEVNKSFYFKGRYIYKGDILRFEDSNFEDLKVAMDDFFELAKNPFYEVIFYTIKYKDKYDLNKLK